MPGQHGPCKDGDNAERRRCNPRTGEERNQREDKNEHSKAAVGCDLHGLGHHGLPWLYGDGYDEGHPAQNRRRILVGGQLEGVRPEADGADYHRGDSGRGRRGGGRKGVHPEPLAQVPELRHKDTGKLPHKAWQQAHGEICREAERRRVPD